MKYKKDHIYSTENTIKVTTSRTGNKAMILEKGQDKATLRQGFRVVVDFEGEKETVWCGEWSESEVDSLKKAVKCEYYKAKAYQELYCDLLQKLNSIGLVLASENEETDDRF